MSLLLLKTFSKFRVERLKFDIRVIFLSPIFSTLLHVKIVGITISFYDDLLDISFNTNEQMAR